MKAMPARIVTAPQLRDAQLAMARLAHAPQGGQPLALPAAAGRVLAQTLDVRDTNGLARELPAGTRLDWYLLPLLAAAGHGAVPVFAPVRGAVVPLPGAADEAAVTTVMLQAALQQVGVRTLGTTVSQPPLELFARHCELLLAIEPAAAANDGPGLAPPRSFKVEGRLCIVLPASPLAALATFVAFVVPVVRRLQGRALDLPLPRTALEDGADPRLRSGQALVSVSARGHGDATRVKPAQGLEGVAGIAWRADGLFDERGPLLAYLPLDEWLY